VRILKNTIRNVTGYGIYVAKGKGNVSDIEIEGNGLTSCVSGLQFYLIGGKNTISQNIVRATGANHSISFSVIPLPGSQTLFTDNVSDGYKKSNIAAGVIQRNNNLN
jgi:hypothetical protein